MSITDLLKHLLCQLPKYSMYNKVIYPNFELYPQKVTKKPGYLIVFWHCMAIAYYGDEGLTSLCSLNVDLDLFSF